MLGNDCSDTVPDIGTAVYNVESNMSDRLNRT